MKKIILLLVISMTPSTSFADFEGDFNSMNCTQAVTWAASQIASPPPPNFTSEEWSKFISNGGAETVAIQILSVLPGSPCFENLLEKNPAIGKADGKKR